MPFRPAVAIALLAAVATSACHSDRKKVDALDNDLVANQQDPALASALNDQIMVDPALTRQSNDAAVRPPAQPYTAESPAAGGADRATGAVRAAPAPGKDCPQCATRKGALTLGELAKRQQGQGLGTCAANVQYSATWANRLGDLALYPGAAVTEAAGSNDRGCALRVVSFKTAAAPTRVIDWYYTQATKAGYDGEQQTDGTQRILGGTRKDGGAYVVFVDPAANGGSAVDLVVNNGR